ncbi:electron transfer flavoprotein subunit alpha/FixB family protein [Vibrio penaeicida]|uniref:Electron transfer flavoprotein subunit alpha n=1 Tax=Vibrio penaeicida TaxID=104609 RepID=A0AAV5NZ96_9VIBR|nr:electron transfer flavoprotein subunit alpha/FixB family protein [Vibrio penaeicida]RTZ22686.1 electron transfer flavoprotein subunit alpha/FixB family protein [Vibrio penaeicida]GLQ75644.1 electron transfer flavoprotein subunit alpha [Vibrio penaeicida]
MSEIIVRRDPRRERIARNRLHPEHTNLGEPQYGPTGLIRKKVHGIGFIGPSGVKRIDRLNLGSAATSSVVSVRGASQELKRQDYTPESTDAPIMVVLETTSGKISEHGKDILGLAHKQASSCSPTQPVDLVLFGELKEELGSLGVDRVVYANETVFLGYNPEGKAKFVYEQVMKLSPRNILIAESDDGSGELGRRLAASLNVRPSTNVYKWQNDQCHCLSSKGTRQYVQKASRVMLLLPECEEPVTETSHACIDIGAEINSDLCAPIGISDKGSVDVDPATISLGEAEFILSGGNGVKDWALFKQLASELGATMGASRVAVDDGFMPRSTQVGATGTWVTARVYIAVGISGAVQHLQGIEKCEKVIAINTDLGCDMIKRSELSVIADSSEIMKAMSVLLRKDSDEIVIGDTLISRSDSNNLEHKEVEHA